MIVDESGVTMGESQGYPHMATPDRFVADNGLTVNQAYGIWMASDELTIHFGRTSLELADGSVLAKNDFEQVPTAMDGLLSLMTWSLCDLSFGTLILLTGYLKTTCMMIMMIKRLHLWEGVLTSNTFQVVRLAFT